MTVFEIAFVLAASPLVVVLVYGWCHFTNENRKDA